MQREKKRIKNKLILRQVLSSDRGGNGKVLEKAVVVSQLGSIKGKEGRVPILRPLASEFTVWLESKKYYSSMRLNEQSKSMDLQLLSPESKWNGSLKVPFPRSGQHFCFFSQLPECLYHSQLLERAKKKNNQTIRLHIVWENFPFAQEYLTQAGGNLFSPATVTYEGTDKVGQRFVIETEGQIILYHFSKSFDLVRISWIAQGITVVPQGEEVPSDTH